MSHSRTFSGRNLYRRALQFEHLEERVPLAVFTVNTAFDAHAADGKLSLREAIILANRTEAADTIEFAPSLQGKKISLVQGGLHITESLTINGLGAGLLTIDACKSDPTPNQDNGDGSRVFKIDDGNNANRLNVTIRGLTITGGDIASHGGGILNRENLTIEECTISGNAAVGNDKFGGGIQSSHGTLTITDSIIQNNVAGGGGGGIYSRHGDTLITGSVLQGNVGKQDGGGGIVHFRGDLTITDSVVSGNRATGSNAYAGGIAVGFGDLTITGTTVSGNRAVGGGGGVFHTEGELIIIDSVFTENESQEVGGAIAATKSDVTIQDTTIRFNTARAGAGIGHIRGNFAIVDSLIADNLANRHAGVMHVIGDLLIENSTISGNRANSGGAGVYVVVQTGDNAVITHSTITRNELRTGNGAGVLLHPDSTVRLELDHTIVAENVGGTSAAPDIAGGPFGARYSLIGIRGSTHVLDRGGNLIGSSASPVDPGLRKLDDNGGSTLTHGLLAASPARNTGDPDADADSGGVPEFDQRGASYSRVAEGRIDIGAFERQ